MTIAKLPTIRLERILAALRRMVARFERDTTGVYGEGWPSGEALNVGARRARARTIRARLATVTAELAERRAR